MDLMSHLSTRQAPSAARKQQVPPLRRRWRSGSGRNDQLVKVATKNPPAGGGRVAIDDDRG